MLTSTVDRLPSGSRFLLAVLRPVSVGQVCPPSSGRGGSSVVRAFVLFLPSALRLAFMATVYRMATGARRQIAATAPCALSGRLLMQADWLRGRGGKLPPLPPARCQEVTVACLRKNPPAFQHHDAGRGREVQTATSPCCSGHMIMQPIAPCLSER